MPIQKNTSPLHHIRTEFQKMMSLYGPELIEEIITEVGLIQPTTEKKIEIVRLDDAANYYLLSASFLGLSSSSQKTYRSEMNQFVSYGKKSLGMNVSLQEVIKPQFLLEYLQPYKFKNTHSKKSAFLRTFLGKVLNHFLHESIGELKNILKIKEFKNNLPRAFTKIQLAELVCLSQQSTNDFRNFTIIWTFLGSGIRLSELCKLTIADIQTEDQSIFVIPKGRESQKVPRKISEFSLIILNEYIDFKYAFQKNKLSIEEYNTLYIFSCNNGKTHISQRTVQLMIKKLIESATEIDEMDKKRFSVHTFRHSFAIYGLESGIDIYTLSILMGHNNINSTSVYLKLFDSQLRVAIEQHPFANKNNEKSI